MYSDEKHIFPWGGRSNFRIPSMIVTNSGTILAFCNDRKDSSADHASEVSLVLRKKKPGEPWGEIETLVGIEGWHCAIQSAVYDNEAGKAFVFLDKKPVIQDEFGKFTKDQLEEFQRQRDEKAKALGIKPGGFVLESDDDGETWTERAFSVNPVEIEHWDGTKHMIRGYSHGSAHGIQLRHGKYKGRLLCPTRTMVGIYTNFDELQKVAYNNAMYSDDHGKTWQASACVQLGTGEGTLIENGDGTITYNSRSFISTTSRPIATSTDGGATWHSFRMDDFLIEDKRIGCNASFIRVELDEIKNKTPLPEGAEDVTVFCNPRAQTRDNMSACVSFDSGKTYKHVKSFYPGHSAYSSLIWNPITQTFCLIYEHGDKDPYNLGLSAVEFDLEWLLS